MRFDLDSGNVLDDPVDGPVYSVRGWSAERDPGAVESGWLLFDVSQDYSFDDLGVQWESGRSDVYGSAEWWR